MELTPEEKRKADILAEYDALTEVRRVWFIGGLDHDEKALLAQALLERMEQRLKDESHG